MIFQAIHERIEAEPVVLKTTGEEMFWLKETGAMIGRDAFAALYQAEKVERVARAPRQPVAKKRKRAPKPMSKRWNNIAISPKPAKAKAPTASPVADLPKPLNETKQLLLDIIEKQPTTSSELIKACPGLPSQTIYQALHELRKSSLIHTERRDSDGQMANHLGEAKTVEAA